MRILIAADTYPPDVSGSSVFTERLATGLARHGHEVHVVAASDTGPTKLVVEKGMRLHRLRSVPLLIHPRVRFTPPPLAPHAVRELVAHIRPDVVHTQDHFTIGRIAVRAAVARGIPIVATNHFMPENLTPYVPPPLRPVMVRTAWADFRRVYTLADRVTTPTPTAADLLRRHGWATPVEAVSCGVDVDRFGRRHDARQARDLLGLPQLPTIGYVGRLDTEKHLHELLQALPLVLREQDAQVVIAGIGTQREHLQHLASRLRVEGRVHFLGFVPDDLLPQVYEAMEVFCLPGIAELQSIATLEAMSCGLPVVLADAVALPHLVPTGENGILFTPGDVPGLADGLGRILASPSLREQMGTASHELALRHSIDATVTRFEQIYSEVIQDRAAALREGA